MTTTKVFVGNLAFQTTDQALAESFQDCGKVKSGVVITRGRRSLGYGFVEFESPDSAIEAVKSKNNTQLKGRTLKVELASDNPVRSIERISNNSPPPPNASSRISDPSNPSSSMNNNNASGGGDGTGAPRRRKRNPRRRRNDASLPSSNKPVSGGDHPADNKNPASPSSPRGPKNNNNNNTYDNTKPPRRPRERRNNNNNNNNNPVQSNEERVLSKTAVFVANLPFTVKDEELLFFFKDNNPKAAHVVVTRNGRSRGYGFVDFDHEKDQMAAIGTKNNLLFTDRIITVTPSYKTQELSPLNDH